MSSSKNKTLLIVGLGNPGTRYSRTRHNAGFLVLDRLSHSLGVKLRYSLRSSAWIGKGDGAVLAKPDRFMNETGPVVARLSRRFAAVPLVVSDDLDLPLGSVRFREKGSAGGHRGLESVISSLGNSAFPRLKIGIGRPRDKEEVVEYVLAAPSPSEREAWENGIEKAVRFLKAALADGIARAASGL